MKGFMFLALNTYKPNPLALFKRIDTQTTSQGYQDREVIFEQGNKADAMFYIHKGSVKLTVASESGKKKAVIDILRHGDFFGEGCLVKQSLRISTATAIQPSTIARLKRAAMVSVIHQDPAVGQLLIEYLLSRLGRLKEEFADQIISPSEKRLARTLLLLANFGVEAKSETARLEVSQETLAEMIGSTRSRVCYFMNRFRKMGLIEYNGGLRVHRALRTFLSHE
jgi:CRP-like cAMP-binding protein